MIAENRFSALLLHYVGFVSVRYGQAKMATIQQKADAWYGQFLYGGRRHTMTVGRVSERDAIQWRLRTDQILQKIKQGWIEVPEGMAITEFIECDGKPPAQRKAPACHTTFAKLRDEYVTTFSNGAIEANSLYTCTIHLKQIEKTLGGRFHLPGLSMPTCRSTSTAARPRSCRLQFAKS